MDKGKAPQQAPVDALSKQPRDYFFTEPGMLELVNAMRGDNGIGVSSRKWLFTTYPSCWVGRDAVQWLVERGFARDRDDAVAFGQSLMKAGAFIHVTRDHPFKDAKLFYRFMVDEPSGGATDDSWKEHLPELISGDPSLVQPSVRVSGPQPLLSDAMMQAALTPMPLDKHNAELLDNVHPKNWVNPAPASVYNLVVIGAGAAGLVSAAGSAGLGARVAIIERENLGGDCLNTGCVPSKALLRAAKAVHAVRNAAAFGVHIKGDIEVDFGAVMERMRAIRAHISHHDAAERFTNQVGMDVFFGQASFVSRDTIKVEGGHTLRFAKAVIASGGRPAVPDIVGLADAGYHTSASIWNITTLPARLVVLGAGAIGCELAQAFARFGSRVTVVQRGAQILPKEEEEAAAVVRAQMEADGVTFLLNTKVERVEQKCDGGAKTLFVVRDRDEPVQVECDLILVATGRRANTENMNLDVAGVQVNSRGLIAVNDQLQTNNSDIFACGDCASQFQFTHMADAQARIVIRNALFFGSAKSSQLLVPWCTYTSPEIAHVGAYERDLKEAGQDYFVITRRMSDVDRAICDSSTDGYVRVLVKKGSDRILGATVVSPDASNLVSEISVAMVGNIGLATIATVIHPYPSEAEAIKQIGDEFNRTKLTVPVKALFRRLFQVRR